MMALCGEHAKDIEKMLRDRGLYDFVSKSPEVAQRRFQSENENGSSLDTYDPFTASQLIIAGYAIEMGWTWMKDHVQRRCPICEANACAMPWWIWSSVYEVVGHIKHLQQPSKPEIHE